MQNIQPHASLRDTLIPNLCTSTKIDVPSVETLLIWRDFNAQPRNFNAKLDISLDILQAFAFRKKSVKTSTLQVQETKGSSAESRCLV